MKNEPLVSIVMPTFNRDYCIGRAIESVEEQTYSNWQLIIVNDNSTDDTDDVVQKYQQRNPQKIKYIKLSANRGASGARNRGMEEAEGEYITFLDTDDEYLPEKVYKQVKFFHNTDNKSLGIVSCGAIDFRNGKEYYRRMPIKRSNYYISVLARRKKIGAATPLLMVKADVIKENKISFDVQLPSMEDWDFVLQVCLKNDFDFVPEYLLKVNHHDNARMYTRSSAVEGLKMTYEKYKGHLISEPWAHKRFVKNATAIIAHHGSINEAFNYLQLKIADNPNVLYRNELRAFKIILTGFYSKFFKLFYLKYFK